MPAAELPACVFCGEPIGPGEETAGRAPMAAHARCADAALADDSHWDAISSASPGETGPDAGGPETPGAATGRPGCLGVLVLALVVVALVMVAVASLGLLA